MAWFNSIIGGGTANNYINPATATSASSSTVGIPVAGSILQTNNAQNYWASAQSQSINTFNDRMYTVKNYADAIGWSVTHHHLPVGVTSDDPKIAILKITSVGEVLKDVGVRTSDTDYYVMREPSE